MQAGKVGLAGQAFALALASSNDSGGKKLRIRRSKEERKSMAESFIKKYQESNDGNFPSLNLAHKEVGGSFYTVREIIREIIQENRVLAPPKVSMEENGLSGHLEQHPLGSISIEPIIDLPVVNIADVMAMHIAPNEVQISSSENGSYPLKLNNEQTGSGGCKLSEKDGVSDRTSDSHHAPDHFQDNSVDEVTSSPRSKIHKFEENIVNGFAAVDGSPHSDKPITTSADRHDEINEGSRSKMLNNEQFHIKNEDKVDKNEEFGQRISTAIKTLDQEKVEAQHVEPSPSMKSHTNSDIMVETFPLRPVSRIINNMVEVTSKLEEAAESLEGKGVEQEKKTFTQNYSSFVSEEGAEKLPHSTVDLNGEISDAKVVLNLQSPSMENVKHSSASKPSPALDADDIGELESKVSLSNGAKSSSSTKSSTSEDSTTVKGNNPTLDRINLETWDRGAKKSPQPENNPLVTLVKAIISSFVKFWTE